MTDKFFHRARLPFLVFCAWLHRYLFMLDRIGAQARTVHAKSRINVFPL